MRVSFLVALIFLATLPAATSAQISGRSKTCGPLSGKTQADLDNLRRFCDGGVPADLAVAGAISMETLLWVKVDRELANAILRDKLSAENMVKVWMAMWKKITDSAAVSIYVEFGSAEIVRGVTTIFSGDKVTFTSR